MSAKFEINRTLDSKEQKKLDGLNSSVKNDFKPNKLRENGYPELIKRKVDLPSSIEKWDEKVLAKLSRFLVPGCELKAEIDLILSASEKDSKWYKDRFADVKSQAFNKFHSYSSGSDFNKILLADTNIIKILKVGLLDNQAEVITRLGDLNIDNLFKLNQSKISRLDKENKIRVLDSILKEQSADFEFRGQIKVYIKMLNDQNLPVEVEERIDKFIYERVNELRAVRKVTGDSKSMLRNFSNRLFGRNGLDTKEELDLDPENGVELAKKAMNTAKDALGWTAETFKNAPGPMKVGMVILGIWGTKFLASSLNQFTDDSKTKENLSYFSRIIRTVAKVALGAGIVWGGAELYKKYNKRDSEKMNMFIHSTDAIKFFGLQNNKDSEQKVNAAMESIFYDDVFAEKSLKDIESAYSGTKSSKDIKWRKLVRNTENLDKQDNFSPENAREGIGLMIRRYSPNYKDDKLSIYNKSTNSKEDKNRIKQIWEQALLKGDDWRDVIVACMAFDKEFAKNKSVGAIEEFNKEAEAIKAYEKEVSKLEVDHGLDKIWIEGGKLFVKGKGLASSAAKGVKSAAEYLHIDGEWTVVPLWEYIGKPTTKAGRDLYNYLKKRGEDTGYIKIDDLNQYVESLSTDGWKSIPYAKKIASGLSSLGLLIKENVSELSDVAVDNDVVGNYDEFKKRFIDNKEGAQLSLIPKKISIYGKDIKLQKGHEIHMAGLNNKMIFPGSKSDFLRKFDIRFRDKSGFKGTGYDIKGIRTGKEVKEESMYFNNSDNGKYTLIDLPPNVLLTAKKDSVSLKYTTFYAQHFAYADTPKRVKEAGDIAFKQIEWLKKNKEAIAKEAKKMYNDLKKNIGFDKN